MKEQVSGTSVCDVSCLKLVNGRGYNLIVYFAGIRKSYPINVTKIINKMLSSHEFAELGSFKCPYIFEPK